MSIARKRDEILGLIERMNRSAEDEPPPRPPRAALGRRERPAPDPQTLTTQVKRALAARTEAIRRRPARELVPAPARRVVGENRDASLVDRVARVERRLDEVLAYLVDLPHPAATAEPVAPAQLPTDAGDWTFAGVIQEGILADMLQLVSSNVMSGVFSVVGDGAPIEMFFHEGELKHAQCGELEGESAFFAAMATEQGRYSFRESKEPPPKQTISNKTQFLILEALRQIDEARAG